MNPFFNPEFWLSLAFLIVIGMIFFSPIREKIASFFMGEQQKIKNQIDQSNELYHQSQVAYRKILKEQKIKVDETELNQKIAEIKKEFAAKEKRTLDRVEQDFSVRQNLILKNIKNHLRDQLLDQAEKKILDRPVSSKNLEKEIKHFLHVFHANEEELKRLV